MPVICPECRLEMSPEDLDHDCENTCDGRYIPAVSDYASTCDWCYQLTMHKDMVMDLRTQLGYCEECQKIPQVAAMIEAGRRACPDGNPLPICFDKNGESIWVSVWPVQ